MSRQVFISNEEIQRAKQLRDQSRSIADYRKALSVILVAELGLAEMAANKSATRQLTNWGGIYFSGCLRSYSRQEGFFVCREME